MKSFSDFLNVNETVYPPNGEDEQRFFDKHVVNKKKHPVAKDNQFTATTPKTKRKADLAPGEDEEIYEAVETMTCEECGEEYEKGSKHECSDDDDEEDDVKEEMSKAQMTKREKIVKGMKKNMSSFKDKYGDNAKNVMYATATKMSVKEETQALSESAIDDLRNIVKTKSAKKVKLSDGSSITVDLTTASAITQVHDKLNDANKSKFADALGKNETMFMKMVDFAFSGGKK
jgi:hypothetical protein